MTKKALEVTSNLAQKKLHFEKKRRDKKGYKLKQTC